MPRRPGEHIPKLRLHKATSQAVVTIDGRDHYLGKHGSPEATEAYDRLITEWLANGRSLPTPAGEDPANPTIGQVMLRYWKHVEVYYRKPDGTPLHCATMTWYNETGEYISLIDTLVSNGAVVDAQNSLGVTPLMKACSSSTVAVDRDPFVPDLLLHLGADISLVDSRGFTALHHAAIRNGADILGRDPLPYNLNVIKLLVQRGANVFAKTSSGKTPLDLAREYNRHRSVIGFLEKSMADKARKHRGR